jgi:hypothetical protein
LAIVIQVMKSTSGIAALAFADSGSLVKAEVFDGIVSVIIAMQQHTANGDVQARAA